MSSNKTISILGCGWYGLPLAEALVSAGYTVKGSTTSQEKLPVLREKLIQPFLINTADNSKWDYSFFDCDILWIAIPPRSRYGGGEQYVQALERVSDVVKQYRIKDVILISSTGVYGDTDSHVNENMAPQPGSESGKVILQAESLLRNDSAFRTTVVRFGGLVGPERHPGRFFAGKRDIPNGKAPVNLIHLDDCIGISIALLEKEAFGYVINACSPAHPEKQQFYTEAALAGGYEKPVFVDELLEWKIVDSIICGPLLSYDFSPLLK
jgi:nucleoside-diphosphate-sugar epimerase